MTRYKIIPPSQQRGVLYSDTELDERSIVVIGDIHGCAHALRDLLTKIIYSNCRLVFVGDLVDRGERFPEVATIVHSLCENPENWGIQSAVCLMGNHEKMILDAMAGRDYTLWWRNGGLKKDIEWIKKNNMSSWIEKFPYYYEHPKRVWWGDKKLKLLVTHGSVNPTYKLEDQDQDFLVWGRDNFGFSRDHITVHGHTICENATPRVFNTVNGPVLRLDTGSFCTGVVTGVAFHEVL